MQPSQTDKAPVEPVHEPIAVKGGDIRSARYRNNPFHLPAIHKKFVAENSAYLYLQIN